MLKRMILGAALVAFAAGAAVAADVPVKGPVYKVAPAPVFNWTGFYVGGHAGGAWGDSDFANGVVATDLGGYTAGLHLGYNWQFSQNFVFSAEFGWSHADINGGVNLLGGLARARHSIDQMYDVGARLGYLIGPRTMAYAGAGYVWADADAAVGIAAVTLNASAKHKGWMWRVGLEHAISENWSFFGEYRGYELKDAAYTFPVLGTANGKLDLAEVRIGVNYRFNFLNR